MGLEALGQDRGGIGWYWESVGPLGLNWGHWNKAEGAEIVWATGSARGRGELRAGGGGWKGTGGTGTGLDPG